MNNNCMRLSLLLAAAICLPARGADLCIVTGRIYTELLAHPSEMDDIRNTGAKMIRVAFEDQGDAGQMAAFRNVVALAKARGVSVMGLLDMSSAPWGTVTTQAYRDAYVNSVIWHIKSIPDVKIWEIWNEPENFGFQTDPSRYAPLLIQTFDRVSSARTSGEIPADTKIVCAGVVDTSMAAKVFDAVEFQQYRAAHNGDVPFDYANYHPYSAGDPWDAAPRKPNGFREGLNFTSWFNKIATMTGADGRLLFGDKPFFFTEFGFSTSNFGVANARTALLHMAESMNALTRIQKAFWYDYRDDAEDYGLRYANGGKTQAAGAKPVYYAFAAEALGVGIYRPNASTTPTVLDNFIDAYIALGWKPVVGTPAMFSGSTEAQRSGAGWVQRFSGGSAGSGALTRADNDSTDVHWLKQPFLAAWDYRGGGGGALGYPVSERMTAYGVDRQNTEKGFVMMDDGGATAGLFGDPNGDWTITRRDAATALEAAVSSATLGSLASASCDIVPKGAGGAVGDGVVNVLDVVRLLGPVVP